MMSSIKLFKFGLVTTQSTRLYNRLISVRFSSVSSSLEALVLRYMAALTFFDYLKRRKGENNAYKNRIW